MSKQVAFSFILVFFIGCMPSQKKKEKVTMMSNMELSKKIKDSSLTTTSILNDLLSNIENEQKYFCYGDSLFEDNRKRQLMITTIKKPAQTVAIEYLAHDSIVNFYTIYQKHWKCIGSEKTRIPIYTIDFEDLDGDEKPEIISKTSKNMNGNSWMEIYYRKSATNISYAGNFSTDYEIIKGKKQIKESYEGSEYMDPSKTLYEWKNQQLIPLKKIQITHKEDGNSYFEIYTNPKLELEGLELIQSERYINNEKQNTIWGNF